MDSHHGKRIDLSTATFPAHADSLTTRRAHANAGHASIWYKLQLPILHGATHMQARKRRLDRTCQAVNKVADVGHLRWRRIRQHSSSGRRCAELCQRVWSQRAPGIVAVLWYHSLSDTRCARRSYHPRRRLVARCFLGSHWRGRLGNTARARALRRRWFGGGAVGAGREDWNALACTTHALDATW